MAGRTERDQGIRLITSPSITSHDVVYFQKPGPPATRGLAAVFITRQHLSAHAGRDRGRVSAAVFANGSIAAHSF